LTGWFTDSDTLDKIPKYRPDGKIFGFSSLTLPEALTAPEYIISNDDRDSIVLRGTICDSNDRHLSKGRTKTWYAAIFCDQDSSLVDGTYVFRINGALSRDHPHSKTKWELCGIRGTSDEELRFTMVGGSCRRVKKQNRWQMARSNSLASFSGSLAIQLDDAATIQAIDDVEHNEAMLIELEAALFAAISSANTQATSVSMNAVVYSDGYLRASFGIHLDTGSYIADASLAQMGTDEFITAELQTQLTSASTLTKLLDELHKYPEFTASSSVAVDEVSFEGGFFDADLQGIQYDTTEDDDQPVPNMLAIPYSFIGLAAIGFAVMLTAIFQVTRQ
jgi:hypothetical protein